jgi:hypothetical protein
MDGLFQNWMWLLIGMAFVALHFGHGGHSRHGGGEMRRATARIVLRPDGPHDEIDRQGHRH